MYKTALKQQQQKRRNGRSSPPIRGTHQAIQREKKRKTSTEKKNSPLVKVLAKGWWTVAI